MILKLFARYLSCVSGVILNASRLRPLVNECSQALEKQHMELDLHHQEIVYSNTDEINNQNGAKHHPVARG